MATKSLKLKADRCQHPTCFHVAYFQPSDPRRFYPTADIKEALARECKKLVVHEGRHVLLIHPIKILHVIPFHLLLTTILGLVSNFDSTFRFSSKSSINQSINNFEYFFPQIHGGLRRRFPAAPRPLPPRFFSIRRSLRRRYPSGPL